jgi:hypothetical protein
MSPIGLYFSAGLALFFVVLWDYTLLSATARRITRQPPAGASQFARLVLGVRNMGLMALVAFFLWPLVLLLEIMERVNK